MKIVDRGIAITEVSRLTVLHVAGEEADIGFTGTSARFTFTREELQEVHAAIGEALKYMAASSVENPTEPRSWREGDPEPTDVITVVDNDGDRWEKSPYGTWRFDGLHSSWGELVRNYGPVQEAK